MSQQTRKLRREISWPSSLTTSFSNTPLRLRGVDDAQCTCTCPPPPTNLPAFFANKAGSILKALLDQRAGTRRVS